MTPAVSKLGEKWREVYLAGQGFLVRLYLEYILLRERLHSKSTQDDLAIKEVFPGSSGCLLGRDLCIFVHYDKDGLVDPHVLFYIRALAAASRDIIFVSNSPSLDKAGVQALRPLCHEIILRENRGYDFGAWKTGLSRIGDVSAVNTLILANDSVYGPLKDLGPIIERMDRQAFDFWGITDSYELGHHIQSYFVFYNQAVLASSTFQRFWKRLALFENKLAVICAGELGLPSKLRRAGFSMGAACSYEKLKDLEAVKTSPDISAGIGGKPNPVRVFWKPLIEACGCPFLKVDIVRDQSTVSKNVEQWRSVVEEASSYDPGLIEKHLSRVRTKEIL